MNCDSLDSILNPRSIALVGVTTDAEHWTRTFLSGLLEFGFEGSLYLVNPKGGEIDGFKLYHSIKDVPESVDYVIGLVPARVAPGLVREAASKGAKAIQFGTAGFAETGSEHGRNLQNDLIKAARETGIRVIGPNCMGIYSPGSGLSFCDDFPKEKGLAGFISQSGGNTFELVREAGRRGVRFSKVVSYGNASDLNESDFLEYMATDSETKIIAVYIEGVEDGTRFREALGKAASEKPVVLLKGGITEAGTRAASGHTGALAGSEAIWEALCKQLEVMRVYSLQELADMLVTLSFMSRPAGRRVGLVGLGGGASVLITDDFERRGLKVPSLPEEVRGKLREFSSDAGNIFRNPVDYSQAMEVNKAIKTFETISQWDEIDFLIGFTKLSQTPKTLLFDRLRKGMLEASKVVQKPMAFVIEPELSPEKAKDSLSLIQEFTDAGLPVYYSFASAANAISLRLGHAG